MKHPINANIPPEEPPSYIGNAKFTTMEYAASARTPPNVNINNVFHFPIKGLINDPIDINAKELKKI